MNAAQARAIAKLGAVVSTPNDWQRRRFQAILECRNAGLSYAEIGAAIGVSKQAVHEFVHSWLDKDGGRAA